MFSLNSLVKGHVIHSTSPSCAPPVCQALLGPGNSAVNKTDMAPDQRCSPSIYELVRAAMTEDHTLGGFNNRNLFSHDSAG